MLPILERPQRTDLVAGGLAALIALAAACSLYRPWVNGLSIPWIYSGGDSASLGALVKGTFENGWFWQNDALGAPDGQHFIAFPLPEVFHFVVFSIAGLFTDEWAVVFNLYYLLTFPAAAIAMYWLCRTCRIRPITAITIGSLYALVPFHFSRGPGHLFYSCYWVLPLAAWLLLSPVYDRTLFSRSSRARLSILSWLVSATSLRTLGISLLIATTSAYFAIFTVVCLPVSMFAASVWKSRREVLELTATGTVLLGTVFLATTPTLLFRQIAGSGTFPLGNRAPGEAEIYGLKITQMLLPPPYHFLHPFKHAYERYVETFPLPGESWSPALGLVGAAGLVFLLLRLVIPRADIEASSRVRTLVLLARLVIVCILVATIGGGASLISLWITPQIRGWNRISILIATFSLLGVGIVIDSIVSWARRLGTGLQRTIRALPVVLLVVGMVDQIPHDPPNFQETKQRYGTVADLVRHVETDLPSGATVFQLPIVDFPEGDGPASTLDYDNLIPYLHSKDLRWSAGAIRGREEANWQVPLRTATPPELLAIIRQRGFDGLWIDTYGYADRGEGVVVAFEHATSHAPLRSSDNRYVYFDLR